MKVNDSNIPSTGITSGSITTNRPGHVGHIGPNGPGTNSNSASTDDVHLSELVRSLRSLAADSPERQAKIEQLARSYADGSYKTDPSATASAIIKDALNK